MPRFLRALPAALLLLAACGGPPVSKGDAAASINASGAFKSAKLAYVPRVLLIPAEGLGASAATREGEAVTLEQLATVDPVVAVLKARAAVQIEDFVSATPGAAAALSAAAAAAPAHKDSAKTDSAKGGPSAADSAALRTAQKDTTTYRTLTPQTSAPPAPSLAQSWTHTLRVTPGPGLGAAELAPDDGEENPDSPRPIYGGRVARTPGWTFAIGTRELIRILDVSNRPRMRDTIPGDVFVEFSWRWHPTAAGALFDAESAEFQSLPSTLQEAAQRGDLRLDSGARWSRAILARTREGGWRVTKVEWNYGEGRTPPS